MSQHWTRETTQVLLVRCGLFCFGWAGALHGTQNLGFLANDDSPANQSPNGQAKSDAQEYSAGKANPIRTWQQLGNPLMRIRNTWER